MNTGRFIYITDGGIGHIEKEVSNEILGFYTSDVQTCLCLALVGINEEEGRLSFIHYDVNRKEDLVRKEFRWGNKKNSILYLFSTKEFPSRKEPTLSWKEYFEISTIRFLTQLNYKSVKLESYNSFMFQESNFRIDRRGSSEIIDKNNLDPLLYDQEKSAYVRFYKFFLFTNFTKYKTYDLDIQYVNGKFTPIPQFSYNTAKLINESFDIVNDINEELNIRIIPNLTLKCKREYPKIRMSTLNQPSYILEEYVKKSLFHYIRDIIKYPNEFMEEIKKIPKVLEYYHLINQLE